MSSLADVLSDPDVLFIVAAGMTLTMLSGFVAIVLPDRFCAAWLAVVAVIQLGLGGFLSLGTYLDLSNDIGNALAVAFAVPLFVSGVSSLVMLIAWLLIPRWRQ